jgi:hypothetical protein
VQVFQAEGEYYITAVLQRAAFATASNTPREVQLCAGQAELLTLSVPALRFVASDSIQRGGNYRQSSCRQFDRANTLSARR